MTLTEFLLARIAEDEAVAREATPGTLGAPVVAWEAEDRPGVTELLFEPARVLAECAAKRRVVELHEQDVYPGAPQVVPACFVCANWNEADYDGPPRVEWPCGTLRILALPYADHPDYRAEWRP